MVLDMSVEVPGVGELIVNAFSDPQTAIVILIQFILGLALGYISVKALKYILAFIAILVLGTFLSVWRLGSSMTEVFKTLSSVAEIAKNFAIVLGLITVGPISIGFIIGAVIALIKK